MDVIIQYNGRQRIFSCQNQGWSELFVLQITGIKDLGFALFGKQVIIWMFIHCQLKLSCEGKAHVMGNKGLFDDAVTEARNGLELDTQSAMSDPDKRVSCRDTPVAAVLRISTLN